MSLKRSLVLVLTLKCHESSRLMSEGLDRRLTWSERWALRLHFLGCWSCRRFRRHLQFLRLASTQRVSPGTVASRDDAPLSPEARRRIEAAIRQQIGD